jgi:hypothetical protein
LRGRINGAQKMSSGAQFLCFTALRFHLQIKTAVVKTGCAGLVPVLHRKKRFPRLLPASWPAGAPAWRQVLVEDFGAYAR